MSAKWHRIPDLADAVAVGGVFLAGAVAGAFGVASEADPRGPGTGVAAGMCSVGLLWFALSSAIARKKGQSPASVRRRSALAWVAAGMLLAAYLPVYRLAPARSALAPYVRVYVLAAAVGCVTALHLVLFVSPRAVPPGKVLLAVLLLTYTVIAISLGAYRWRIFTLGNNDSAIVIQSLRYALDEGRPLFNTLEKASHLAVHNSPIYFLLVPLYALWRRPEILVVGLPPFLIAASALPFYALARPKIGESSALILTTAYLLYPSILARAVGDLYEMTFFPALWLATFYYYDRQRPGPFLLFAILSLAVKESIAVTVLFLAFYGIIKRRSLAWILAPLVLGVLSLLLSYAIVLPTFGAGTISSRLATMLGPLGSTPWEALTQAVHQPLTFVQNILTLNKLALFYQLFQPLLFVLPLCSAEIVLALPALGVHLLAQGGSIGIRAWEAAAFGPILFIAALFGLGGKGGTKVRCLAVALLFATISCAPYWFRLEDYRARPYLDVHQAAVDLVPPAAAVSAPDYMLARLADRAYLQLQTGAPFWAEYQIVDMNWVTAVRGHRLTEKAAQEYAELVARVERGEAPDGLRLLWRQEGLYVLRRE